MVFLPCCGTAEKKDPPEVFLRRAETCGGRSRPQLVSASVATRTAVAVVVVPVTPVGIISAAAMVIVPVTVPRTAGMRNSAPAIDRASIPAVTDDGAHAINLTAARTAGV